MMLLAVSIVFYIMGGPEAVPFIFFTSFTIWLGAKEIGKIWEKQKQFLAEGNLSSEEKKSRRERDKKKARWILLLVLIVNLAILINSKLLNYLSVRLARPDLAASIIVPLGISYYTFSTVGYLLDVYWKRYEFETNYFRFLLYAIYYPHIVQGPISRYNKLGLELKKDLKVSSDNIFKGAQLILWGYFKKLVIADRLSIFTTQVFSDTGHNGTIYLVAIIFDVFQIYTDFSGYMDIVRGVSEMFGIELERNFNHPFFSKSVPEFWRRWHMSLGSWFKDYVYYPLTICKPIKKLKKWSDKHLPELLAKLLVTGIPVMITWISTGLWHGTGAGYLAWGIYYGGLITISVVGADLFMKFNHALHIKTDCFSFQALRIVRTFCVFAGGRMLTKGLSLTQALMMVKQLFCAPSISTWFDGRLLQFGLDKTNMIYAVLCILFLWAVSVLQVKYNIRAKLAEQNLPIRWAVFLIGFFVIILFGVYGSGYSTAGFAYQQF
ncbi:MAG: hypothetical protein NC081_01505 [Roseburia sp.]|nr:hypothetical protein [Roseburia sp.]